MRSVHKAWSHCTGFSLMELTVVVAIMGVLSAIAWPGYQRFVMHGRRADARSALQQLLLAQEKYRLTHPTYADHADLFPQNDSAPVVTAQGHYALRIHSATRTGFVATASPVGAQADDRDCAEHWRLTHDGPDLSDAAKRVCWAL